MKNLLFSVLVLCSIDVSFARGKTFIEKLESQGNFSTLLSLLDSSDLTETLNQSKNFTLLAPNDEAFGKLSPETIAYLNENPDVLKKTLLYHVIATKMKAKHIVKQKELKTASGRTIQLFQVGNESLFNKQSRVVSVDHRTRNGILHTIDTVLTINDDTPKNDIETVSYVDLEEYLGTWYEIARYKNTFQVGCEGTTAKYGVKGKFVTVLNTCQREGKRDQKGHALAEVVNKDTNAELSVSFVPFFNLFGLFGGDYNILALGDNYSYSLVGSKDRGTFWILSRTPELSNEKYNELLDLAVLKGYRKDLIIKTPVWIEK
ncbi:lipocalin family protein [Bacteriovoracaceae bacterium]|nr:lipocalin family protein [Bacteriovoracaceae bacterium]